LVFRILEEKIKGGLRMFVVKEKTKEQILREIEETIYRFRSGDYHCNTGAPEWNPTLKRWIIPEKTINLQEVTIFRVMTLLEYLKHTSLRHTTRRDLWYGVTTGQWNLYDSKYCPKCHSADIKPVQKWTGRRKKDGSKVMTTELHCKKCNFVYTDLKNPYDALGGDLAIIERVLGVEKESLGIHSGMKGFIFGSSRMNFWSPSRGQLIFSKRPTIEFDIAYAEGIEGFDKIIMLEKESFVGHLIPIKDNNEKKPNFDFVNAINAAIITSQGYESKYNKSFAAKCYEQGIKPMSLHDADGDGIEMDLILQHHSMAGAHLPDYLIIKPYRLGFFPSIGQKVGAPATPMEKTHIKSLGDLRKRLEQIDDKLYRDEIELLLNQKKRWELQSMSALHPTAGQAYVLEYLRNRKIPLKPKPDLNKIRREIYNSYNRNIIKIDLKYEVKSVVRDYIREKLVNVLVKRVMESDIIKDLITKAIENLEEFPELPDNETLLKVWEDKLSSNITAATKTITEKIIKEFCEVETNAEIDENADIIQEDKGVFLIDPNNIVKALDISAKREFKELKPKTERPDLYDIVLRRCKIDIRTALKFREALQEKFKNIPAIEEEYEIPEEYEPKEGFDELYEY